MIVSCKCGRTYKDIEVFPLHCVCGTKTGTGIPAEESQASKRSSICRGCDYSQFGICKKFKELHPDRPCVIAIGVNMPKAKCPIGKWA